MKKLFASKEVRKAIAKNMSKNQRKELKEGKIFEINIIRYGKHLHRWGAEENTAKIVIGGKSCKIYENNLVNMAWNYNLEKASKEAANALDYFVYGGRDEYEIVVK